MGGVKYLIERSKYSINQMNRRKLRISILFLGFVFIGSILLSGSVSAAGTWHNESVDNIGVTGGYTSLALDNSSGNPHISYFDNITGDLKYASKSGNNWTTETVDTGDVGRYSSLALDSYGNPHISYVDSTNHALKYAFKYSGSWYTQTVDPQGGGIDTSLVLDSSNNPHISYCDGFRLKYASKGTGSTWNIWTVDSSDTYIGEYNSLALDSNGNPHISYYDGSNPGYSLKYATYYGGQWFTQTVDKTGDVGEYTSLALDSSNNPHISYYDYTNKRLKYASESGWGIWTKEIADTGNVGEYTSLALDSTGNPHISYYDNNNCDLKYAFKSGGVWHNETADNTWTAGNYNSLKLDLTGNPHISYTGGGYGNLKYAYFVPNKTTPIVSSIDPANNTVNITNNNVIKIIFSEPVTAGSAYSSISVKNSAKAAKIMKTSISGSLLTLTPVYNYLAGDKYTITIPANAVKDSAGNGFAKGYTSVFTISNIIPSVTSTDPVKGAVNILNNKVIKITFNEPITAGSAYNSITVKNSANTTKTMTASISGSVLTLTPVYNYLTGYKYTITIPANALKDSTGNGLSADYTSSFTIANITPKVNGIDPVNGAINVSNNKVIKITFSEPVTAGSAYNSITVKNSGGAVKLMNASISGSVLTLTPVYNYLTGYKYTITIPANAVKDSTGNGLSADYTSSFTISTT